MKMALINMFPLVTLVMVYLSGNVRGDQPAGEFPNYILN